MHGTKEHIYITGVDTKVATCKTTEYRCMEPRNTIYTTEVDTKIATIEHRSIIAKQKSTDAWNQGT